MNPILLLVVSYLLGAIPTSYWVGRGVYGVDLRTVGSGNLGATNAYRVLGWKAALPVVLVDMAKGFLPAWGFPRIDASVAAGMALAYGGAAILGHVFSVWVRFRGGKGVATSAGVFLGVAPWAFVLAFSAWLLVMLLTRIVSVASVVAALVVPLGVWLTPHDGGRSLVYFAAGLALFVVWSHRANLRRLLKGQERRISTDAGDGAADGAGRTR